MLVCGVAPAKSPVLLPTGKQTFYAVGVSGHERDLARRGDAIAMSSRYGLSIRAADNGDVDGLAELLKQQA